VTTEDGSATHDVPPQHVALIPPGSPSSVKVRAGGDGDAKFMIGGGRPFGERVYKMLGHDGALFGISEEHVRETMLRYENEKLEFGKS
jgi:hypothetical protein